MAMEKLIFIVTGQQLPGGNGATCTSLDLTGLKNSQNLTNAKESPLLGNSYRVDVVNVDKNNNTAQIIIYRKTLNGTYSGKYIANIALNKYTQLSIPGSNLIIRAGIGEFDMVNNVNQEKYNEYLETVKRISGISDMTMLGVTEYENSSPQPE